MGLPPWHVCVGGQRLHVPPHSSRRIGHFEVRGGDHCDTLELMLLVANQGMDTVLSQHSLLIDVVFGFYATGRPRPTLSGSKAQSRFRHTLGQLRSCSGSDKSREERPCSGSDESRGKQPCSGSDESREKL